MDFAKFRSRHKKKLNEYFSARTSKSIYKEQVRGMLERI